jgi:hypothetical protein
MAEDMAVARAVVATERLGIATQGLDEQLQALGTTFIKAGERENAAYDGYRKMVNATGSVEEAQRQLNIALKFAVSQGVAVETVTNGMAKAYGGKQRAITMVLMEMGLLSGELRDYQQLEQILVDNSDGYEKVLDQRAQAVYGLNAAWDTFSDNFANRITPAISTALRSLAEILDKPVFYLLGALDAGAGAQRTAKILTERSMQTMIDDIIAQQGPAPFVGPIDPRSKRKSPARFGKDGAGGRGPAPFDYEGSRAKFERENYMNLEKQMIEAEKERLKGLDAAWLESTKTWREGIDKTSDSLAYLLIDLPFKGKDAWRSFIDSMLSMLRELGAEFLSTQLKAQGLAWLKQLTGYGGGGGSPDVAGPPDSTRGKGFGPRPIGPGTGGGGSPVYVTVTGNLNRYAEFEIVQTGLSQGRKLGL